MAITKADMRSLRRKNKVNYGFDLALDALDEPSAAAASPARSRSHDSGERGMFERDESQYSLDRSRSDLSSNRTRLSRREQREQAELEEAIRLSLAEASSSPRDAGARSSQTRSSPAESPRLYLAETRSGGEGKSLLVPANASPGTICTLSSSSPFEQSVESPPAPSNDVTVVITSMSSSPSHSPAFLPQLPAGSLKAIASSEASDSPASSQATEPRASPSLAPHASTSIAPAPLVSPPVAMAPRARGPKSRRSTLSESDDNGPGDASSDTNVLESPRSTRSSRRAASKKTPRYSFQEEDSADDFEDLRPRAKISKAKAGAKADTPVSVAGSVTPGSTPPSRKRKEPDTTVVNSHSPAPRTRARGTSDASEPTKLISPKASPEMVVAISESEDDLSELEFSDDDESDSGDDFGASSAPRRPPPAKKAKATAAPKRSAAKPRGGAQTLTSPTTKASKPTGLTRPLARPRTGIAGGKQVSTAELLNKMSPRPTATVRTGLAKSSTGGAKSNGLRPGLGTAIPAAASPVRVGLTRHRTAKPKLHAYLYK
ncbi:hypothetical protein H4R35_001000 [Dimargaris xerosporica]|nr:hypothetical protein H4R35_001000 [Dimargaris xerosporica]